jgi:EAL domain-containing protein (putative c-di-GMP-specific phosphodiesterase class I)
VSSVAQVLDDGRLTADFQPIVTLDDGAVVGYEALCRGPSRRELPRSLFAQARQSGRLEELDAKCRSAAFDCAVKAGIAAPMSLFVNVEPEMLGDHTVDELLALAGTAPYGVQLIVEVTERALAARPAKLLAAVQRLRESGWRLALDDVGADDISLAFMPLLRPEVVKLDLRLVQQRPTPAIAGIVNAANAYAERTGTVILAEGIETAEHLNVAAAMGARLGQGWLFGPPEPGLRSGLPGSRLALPGMEVPGSAGASPFACLPRATVLRRSTKPLLVEVSKHLERKAALEGAACIVIASFQEARYFTPGTGRRYQEMATQLAFVSVLGEGMPSEPVAGVRGIALDADDPVRAEWDVVVLTPHFAAALLARDLDQSDVPQDERTFEFTLTYDRDVVIAATRSLLSRECATGS